MKSLTNFIFESSNQTGKKYRLTDEIKEIVGISKSKAYSLIQELNSELKEKGYLTVTGRVSRKYFEERFYGLVEKE